MVNDRSLFAQLAPRQSKALVALTVVITGAVIAALMSLGDSAASLVTWCRHFVIVASTGRVAVIAAVAALLGGIALVSVVNLLLFIVSEIATSLRFSSLLANRAVPLPGRVRAAMADGRICEDTVVVVVVDDVAPFAVSVGMISPRIVLSTGLLATMTLAELRAVLAHESGHVGLRHPLRAVAWEAIRRTFFFLPVIGDIAAHFALAREIAADRHAIRACGQRPLASALLKIVQDAPQSLPLASAPFGHLRSRINALRGGRRTELRVSLRRVQATVAVIGIIATAHVALAASGAESTGGGAQCASRDMPNMSQINFSSYFSIRVAPEEKQMSTDVPPVILDENGSAFTVQTPHGRP